MNDHSIYFILFLSALESIIISIVLTPPEAGTGNLVHKWETWASTLSVQGAASFFSGLVSYDYPVDIFLNTSGDGAALRLWNDDPGILSFTHLELYNDAGQVADIFTTTPALGAILHRYNNSLFVSTTNGGNLILGNIGTGDILFTAGGINNRFEILGSGAVNSYVPTYVQSTLRANDYYSGDNSQGITNTTGLWLCTNSGCTTTCQVQIKDGLITGCV
jgi:hypothetical protein